MGLHRHRLGLLHRPGKSDADCVGIFFKSPVIMSAALPETVHRSIKGRHRGDYQVRRNRRAIRTRFGDRPKPGLEQIQMIDLAKFQRSISDNDRECQNFPDICEIFRQTGGRRF